MYELQLIASVALIYLAVWLVVRHWQTQDKNR